MNIVNLERLNFLCKELGIETLEDLATFKTHEMRENENILTALERYYKEYKEVE